MKKLVLLLLILVLFAGCAQLPQAAQPAPAPQPTATARQSIRVLFIGDSLSQGLDGLFPRLAASGSPPVTVENKAMWRGGFPLEQQWESTKAPDEIRGSIHG